MLEFHTFITWALIGLIWHVQIVQYPLFLDVGREAFSRYHCGHCLRIAFVVVPLMLLEVASAIGVLWLGERASLFLFSLPWIAMVWLATFLIQVPIHDQLTEFGWSESVIQKLVRTNWLRTVAWTVRGLLLAWIFIG
ncbi:hypothetical protein [Prosthecobacter dejongeii]|uniref:DUF1772 domain-containing protein n=1 Tax=Prosthecobacter dejongeii TaxID=48465 RepID=A0A7W8DP81_9BACT|nr:hypothetical protein [Prosthecobacter dejongeii]MBB5036860.1 hypothetical protein [Prosthecobacter dejongeii]